MHIAPDKSKVSIRNNWKSLPNSLITTALIKINTTTQNKSDGYV